MGKSAKNEFKQGISKLLECIKIKARSKNCPKSRTDCMHPCYATV